MKEREAGNWYIFYVGTNREKRAAKMIEQLSPLYGVSGDVYEVYCPNEETKTPDGKVSFRLLFPGYVFLRCENFEYVKLMLKRISSLKIHPSNDPVIPLSKEEVDNIMKIKNKPSVLKESLFVDDEVVKIISGVLKDFTGKIVEINNTKQTAVILINLFGRDTRAELKFSDMERINNK
jgi:transcriptional antiterminator NusG